MKKTYTFNFKIPFPKFLGRMIYRWLVKHNKPTEFKVKWGAK